MILTGWVCCSMAAGQPHGSELIALRIRVAELERQNAELRTALGRRTSPAVETMPDASCVPAAAVSKAEREECLFRPSLWIAAVGLLIVMLNWRLTATRPPSRSTLRPASSLCLWSPPRG